MVPRMRACARAQVLGPLPAHDEEALPARARHDAIEEAERLRDETCSEVLLHGERALHQRMGKAERIVALRDAELAEVFAGRPEMPHVVVGKKREAHVRTAGTVGIDRIPGELAEIRNVVAE